MSRKHKIFLTCLAVLAVYKAVQFISYLNPNKISVATWNVQTVFDADFSGDEYSEYASSKSGWSAEKYYARLLRLADALEAIDADIIALEEVENLNVVHDIANVMPYMNKLRYAAFARQPGSALGMLVLSRWPVTEAFAYQIQLPQTKPETLRPLFEVHVKIHKKNVVLLVNHWKSKASGGAAGGILRQCQQALLTSRISELKCGENCENSLIVALGDFNQKTEEFEIDAESNEVLLRGFCNTEEVKSLWLEPAISGGASGKGSVHGWHSWRGSFSNFNNRSANSENGAKAESAGSYFFRDNWEQIDHIFLASENASFGECGTVAKRMFLRQDGMPNAYKLYSGSGLSDHLPLKAEIFIAQDCF